MSKLFKLVVDTAQYSGNFEREMCAYITGQFGECGVGEEWVKNYSPTIRHLDWWSKHIVNRANDSESPCYRPVAIYPSAGWFNNGRAKHYRSNNLGTKIVKRPSYMSVAIFTSSIPPDHVLEEFTERAREFCSQYLTLKGEISGYVYEKENLTFTGIRIIKGVRKEVLVSEIKFI